MRLVYLDNNATTAVDPLVLEAMLPFFDQHYGNASSIHTPGQKARAAVEEARRQVAELIGAQPREILFTSGGTEADNLAIWGAARACRDRGDHIITTGIEHPAVLRSCERLEKEGFRVTYLPVSQEGRVDLDVLAEVLEEKTILVSIMHANNEVGSLQPIREAAEMVRAKGILFHTDGVQSVGKIPVQVEDLQVDLLSLSAHKIHGPKGVGALYVRQGTPLEPFQVGGSHERGRRAGTENVPGIVGLGKACELALEKLSDFGSRVARLRDELEEGLLAKIPEAVVNGSRRERMPHVSNLSFLGLEGEAILIALDFQGIAVSTGAACSSGSLKPSHVLSAMGLDRRRIQGAIRFSLSRFTTSEEIAYALEVVPQTIHRMREVSPSPH